MEIQPGPGPLVIKITLLLIALVSLLSRTWYGIIIGIIAIAIEQWLNAKTEKAYRKKRGAMRE